MDSHAIIYIIDSTDKERIGESQIAFGRMSHLSVCQSVNYIFVSSEKMVTNESLDSVPLLILANKQDVEVYLIWFYTVLLY